jgi:hypothetical protein
MGQRSLTAQKLSLIATTSKWKNLVKAATNEKHHHRFAFVADDRFARLHNPKD